jgi:hypothetical protein
MSFTKSAIMIVKILFVLIVIGIISFSLLFLYVGINVNHLNE